MFPRRTVRYASRPVRNHSTARIPKPKCVARPGSDTRAMAKPATEPRRDFQSIEATEPAAQVQRPCSQFLGELPSARQKRAHTCGNMQPKRKKVAGEMLVARRSQEKAGRVDHDTERGQQHEPPKEGGDPRPAPSKRGWRNS